MTIAKLATAAEVSPQTVYNSVGGKAEVIKAVYDVRLAGDDKTVVMSERPGIQAVLAAPTAAEALRRYVDLTRLLYNRVGPLLVALPHGPGADPTLAEFLATIDAERRKGNSGIVDHVHRRFGLAAGLDPSHAADIVWTLTSPQLADLLISRCGWTVDAYAGWLTDTLLHSLLGSTADLSEAQRAVAR
jgi:AcrR family transcriptional regulator